MIYGILMGFLEVFYEFLEDFDVRWVYDRVFDIH